MPAREDRHQDLVQHRALPDDASRDLITQPDGGGEEGSAVRGGRGRVRRGQRRAQRTGRRRR
jgi:hypothetical protein